MIRGRNGRAWGVGHGAWAHDRPASPAALAVTAAVVAVVLLSGCPQRQQVIEQTVAAKASDVVAEVENSHVPAELLTWEQIAEVEPGFEEANAVAFDAQGALYVGGDSAVRKFDANGQVEWELPVGGAPTALAVDSTGLVLVGLKGRVKRYWGSEQRPPLVPEGKRTWVTSIAATPTEVFVADAGNRRILRYDASGALLGEIAGMDEARGIPAITVPSAHLDVEIAPPPESGLYAPSELLVVNPGRRSIQYHSLADGALLKSWGVGSNGLEGFGGCCNPTDIALLPDGRVVTAEKGIPRVKVYSGDGALLSVIVPPEGFDPHTEGIDIDADASGRVAVLDPERHIVRLYAENDGEQETVSQ